MKFPAFAYVRARSVAEAIGLLERHGEDARLLAGGQSLFPMMAFRMSSPTLLVDIGSIPELRFIHERDGIIRIGALTRHVDIEHSDLIAKRLPLLSRVMPDLAHAAIRNRGTLGGSLALADPAAQLPACMLALDAVILACGPEGERRIPAAQFFTGTYETALGSDELLTEVEITVPEDGTCVHFSQLSRRHGDFALVGIAATCKGRSDLRLVYLGCGDRPLRATNAESLLSAGLVEQSRAELIAALQHDLRPSGDLQATAEMRFHLAAVLTERALSDLLKARTRE